jgi:hypothetical protein
MRAFVTACLVVVALGALGVLGLGVAQRSSAVAFATDGARINPHWGWRQVFRRSFRNPPPAGTPAMSAEQQSAVMAELGPEGCEEANAYRWILVDFGLEDENDACLDSQ